MSALALVVQLVIPLVSAGFYTLATGLQRGMSSAPFASVNRPSSAWIGALSGQSPAGVITFSPGSISIVPARRKWN